MPDAADLKGKPLADAVRESLKPRVAGLAAGGIRPLLAVVVAGADPAVLRYAEAKRHSADALGIAIEVVQFDGAGGQRALEAEIARLSADPGVHGILLELPLAEGLDAEAAIARIDPAKDVDGLTAANLGLIAAGREAGAILPATPLACIRLAESAVPLAGRRVTVVGRGRSVGRALIPMLVNRDATVTVCHTRTRDLARHTAGAEVLFVAAGRARLIGAAHVAPGQVVVDAGINVEDDGLAGDVDAGAVRPIVAALTPVPGGVGPLTSTLIFENLVRAIGLQAQRGPPVTGDSVWEWGLAAFRDRTASADPTPGGGAAAMVAAAIGLGCVLMALRVTAARAEDRAPFAPLILSGERLLAEISAHADTDVAVFEAYMIALRLPKSTEAEKANRRQALSRAAEAATEAPLNAAQATLEALDLARQAAPLAARGIASDVGAGAAILHGALRAVLLAVDVNLGAIADAGRAAGYRASRTHLERAADARAAAIAADVAARLGR